jgi:hypothetical protein
MKISTHNVIYKDKAELAYEYAYRIACARSLRFEVCVFYLENTEYTSRFKNASKATLKVLKKKGIVQLFIDGEDMPSAEKTEAVYLYNKYSDELSSQDFSKPCFIVKL